MKLTTRLAVAWAAFRSPCTYWTGVHAQSLAGRLRGGRLAIVGSRRVIDRFELDVQTLSAVECRKVRAAMAQPGVASMPRSPYAGPNDRRLVESLEAYLISTHPSV